jgi:hypothetical protein
MKEKVRFLGLDVHAETITVAVAEPDGEVRSLGTIANRAESIRKLVKKLGPVEQLRACYVGGAGSEVRGDRADSDAHEGRRPGEDGPAGRGAIGSQLPVRRSDRGMGAGRGFRGASRFGACARVGQAGPVAGASSAQQVPAADGSAAGGGDESVDDALPGVGAPASLRAIGAASHAGGLSARGRSHDRPSQAPARRRTLERIMRQAQPDSRH